MTAKKEKPLKAPEPTGPAWMDVDAMLLDGVKWIRGHGPLPCDIMIIGEKPSFDDERNNKVFTGDAGKILHRTLFKCGYQSGNTYYTNAVKYLPRNKRAVNQGDIKLCNTLLKEEIRRAKPRIVVCLGATALKAVAGKNAQISTCRGEPQSMTTEDGHQCMLFATFSPTYINHEPSAELMFEKDISKLVTLQAGKTIERDTTEHYEIRSVAQLRQFVTGLYQRYPNPILALDAEWNGITWMHKDRYIRTVQLCWESGKAAVIVMRSVGGTPVIDDEDQAYAVLNELFNDPRVALVGHNGIADGEWLLTYGVDIRKQYFFDTMLAEHVINESGPFGLEELTSKYTNLGHYEKPLADWKKANPKKCDGGYGEVPEELLHPYGAADANATMQIMLKQAPLLEQFTKPRGNNGEYPSLWQTALHTQNNIYELEISGLKVDKERLYKLIDAYQTRKDQLGSVLITMATQAGMPDFNPASIDQKADLLFDKLNLTPVMNTKGRKWVDAVKDKGMDSEDEDTGSTNQQTLQILEDHHPICSMLLNYTRIETACKNQLRYAKPTDNPSTKGGGIEGKIWPDGRLHAHFSQLSDTGRFRHSKPNVANWSKKSEGYMPKAFGGKDKVPPKVRTCIVPADGYVFIEGDFVQAELFVLAGLSGDQVMWEALTTPGKDLHDLTAINSFSLTLLDHEGKTIPDWYLLELAKNDPKQFKLFQEQITYVDLRGKRMTRSEFKDTLRVGAKATNFGRNTFVLRCLQQLVCLSNRHSNPLKPPSRYTLRTQNQIPDCLCSNYLTVK